MRARLKIAFTLVSVVVVIAASIATGVGLFQVQRSSAWAAEDAGYNRPASVSPEREAKVWEIVDQIIPDARSQGVEIRFDADPVCDSHVVLVYGCVNAHRAPLRIHLWHVLFDGGEHDDSASDFVVAHEAVHAAANLLDLTVPAEFGEIDDDVPADEAFADCAALALGFEHFRGGVYMNECPTGLQRIALDMIAQ